MIYAIKGGFQRARQLHGYGQEVEIRKEESDLPQLASASAQHHYIGVAWDVDIDSLEKAVQKWAPGAKTVIVED